MKSRMQFIVLVAAMLAIVALKGVESKNKKLCFLFDTAEDCDWCCKRFGYRKNHLTFWKRECVCDGFVEGTAEANYDPGEVDRDDDM